MKRYLPWLLTAVVLATVFTAYLSPDAQVLVANVWALCGF